MSGSGERDLVRTVTVRGVGLAPAIPDGVIVGLAVRHRSDTAAEALSEVARKARQLESLLREHGVDEDGWVAGSISLREREEWDEASKREVRRGYEGWNRIDVRLAERSRLGELLAEAATRVEASVDGPRWEIRPENPAHVDARARAVEDARRRADTYAKAAGLAVGDVLAMVEGGAAEDGHAMQGTYAATLSASTAMARMPIHSEGLELVASVHVTYALVSH